MTDNKFDIKFQIELIGFDNSFFYSRNPVVQLAQFIRSKGGKLIESDFSQNGIDERIGPNKEEKDTSNFYGKYKNLLLGLERKLILLGLDDEVIYDTVDDFIEVFESRKKTVNLQNQRNPIFGCRRVYKACVSQEEVEELLSIFHEVSDEYNEDDDQNLNSVEYIINDYYDSVLCYNRQGIETYKLTISF